VINLTVPCIVYTGFEHDMSQLESFTLWAVYIVWCLIYKLKWNLGVFVVLRESGSILPQRRCVLSCILIMEWQTMSTLWIISSIYHLLILRHDLNDWWVTVSLSVSVREEPSWVSAGFRKLCQEVAHSSTEAFYPITVAVTLKWTRGQREPKFYCLLY
jgi:hypothetical protein